MIFIWTGLNKARTFEVGHYIRGVNIKGERPAHCILTYKEKEHILSTPNLEASYLATICYALEKQEKERIIVLPEVSASYYGVVKT